MHEPSLTIVIPTVGRACLKDLLAGDLIPQLGSQDEILVVGDGEQPKARAIAEGIRPQVKYLEYGPSRLWGHPQRNWAMLLAKGTHIYCCDDDDMLLPTALRSMRQAAMEGLDKLQIFRVHHGTVIIPWKKVIELSIVSTQCFLVPNIPERFGTWGSLYEGDLHFIQSSVAAHPEGLAGVAWRPEIIAVHGIGGIRPCLPGSPTGSPQS